MSGPPPRPDDSVSVLRLVIGVALLVALIILVFFGIGYWVGRVFV
ncbi:MAG: hypothetical protein WC558_08315 [Patulibacter sp.]